VVLFNNKSIAAWIEDRYFCVIFKAICFQSKIFQSRWNIYLATPNPRARMIGHVANVFTYGHAAHGEGVIVPKTVKVCISVTANSHEHVFGAGNCESGDSQKMFVIMWKHTQTIETLMGYIHQDL